MDDLISRQDAIVTSVRAAIDWHRLANPQVSIAYSIGEAIRALPSVQPERKTGKWLIRYFGDSGKCSVCGMYCGEYDLEDSDRYCRCCGAKMDGLKRIRSDEER